MKRHTILFVDDEENILSSLRRVFRKEGYNILTATGGEEALRLFEDNEISLVISDQRMPEMTGVELVERVRKVSPDTVRIILTGYADIKAAVAAINKGQVFRFIGKPWHDEDIRLVVRDALRQLELKRENERLQELTKRQNRELKELNAHLERRVRERTREIEEKNRTLNKLYRRLRTSFYQTIKVMVELMGLLNPSLGGHSKRVAAMSRDMAIRMGLEENEVSLIETAGILHDIGLIGMPSSVLKGGMKNLSGVEREVYRRHPEMGQATLSLIRELRQVGTIVRSHHERFDGKGFPNGLRGEEIPLASRIIGVVDAYDEMVHGGDTGSEREARKRVREYLKTYSGHTFDPEIVKEFLGYLDELKGITGAEQEIEPNRLKTGMVTSRDIYTESGRLLLGKNVRINHAYLERIRNFDRVDPIRGNVYIYRRNRRDTKV